jgi:hypothetical protein
MLYVELIPVDMPDLTFIYNRTSIVLVLEAFARDNDLARFAFKNINSELNCSFLTASTTVLTGYQVSFLMCVFMYLYFHIYITLLQSHPIVKIYFIFMYNVLTPFFYRPWARYALELTDLSSGTSAMLHTSQEQELVFWAWLELSMLASQTWMVSS